MIKKITFYILLLSLTNVWAIDKEKPGTLTLGKNPKVISHSPDLKAIENINSDDLSISNSKAIMKNIKPNSSSNSRSAVDAYVFKTISPSVVLIFQKEGDSFITGSGSLIDNNGTILTNYHVVKGFKEVGVFFKPEKDIQKVQDSDFRRAKVIKVDQVADLALIKVNDLPKGKSPIKLGDVSDIAVGADVHAIGHPEGQNWSYTKGIISQYRTDFKWLDNQADVIQTQTPINPGNSGGPLLTDRGLLIGVNSFGKKDSNGLNFAVSIDEVKKFIARNGDRLNKTPSKEISNSPPKEKAAQKAKCESKTLYSGLSPDGSAEIIQIDSNCDGKVGSQFDYPLDTSKPYTLIMDTNADGRADIKFFSFQRNSKWDISYWDTNFDGIFDLVGIHSDGAIKPTRFVDYTEYQSNLQANQKARQDIPNQQNSNFHGYASIYFDTDTTVFGWALGHRTQQEANQAGYDICIKRGARGECKQMMGMAARCLAIAQSSKWRQTAYGPTKESAEKVAIDGCNKHGESCYIPNEGSACSSW